ncbi:MAG: hypothetical protein ACOYOF_05280 [Verrucomicrobiaceae bacterium]
MSAILDDRLAQQLNQEFDRKLAQSRPITLIDLAAQSLPERFRNGIARLFVPLL